MCNAQGGGAITSLLSLASIVNTECSISTFHVPSLRTHGVPRENLGFNIYLPHSLTNNKGLVHPLRSQEDLPGHNSSSTAVRLINPFQALAHHVCGYAPPQA